MRFFSLIKLPVVLVLAGLLSACGFHLRGEYSVPEELHTMSFSSYDEYSKLTRYVRSQLQLNKVDLVQPSSSVPNLHLSKQPWMSERSRFTKTVVRQKKN